MNRDDPDALGAHVRNLDGESLVALVTDLWTARGFGTERNGASVVARREGRPAWCTS